MLYLGTVWSESQLLDSFFSWLMGLYTEFGHLLHRRAATAQTSLRIIMRSVARAFAARIHKVMKVQSSTVKTYSVHLQSRI